MVHIDIPRKLKESLTFSDDNDSILKLRRPSRRRASRKAPRMPKKESSDKTLQTVSVSSASPVVGRSCYRFPSRKRLSKKLSSRKNHTSIKESRDDDGVSHSSSSSSSCLTDPSHNDESHDASVESNIEVRDKYQANETVPPLAMEWHHDFNEDELEEQVFPSMESLHIQDCVEEQDALVLQLHIPAHTRDQSENLDVEYLPFKIPVMKSTGVE